MERFLELFRKDYLFLFFRNIFGDRGQFKSGGRENREKRRLKKGFSRSDFVRRNFLDSLIDIGRRNFYYFLDFEDGFDFFFDFIFMFDQKL